MAKVISIKLNNKDFTVTTLRGMHGKEVDVFSFYDSRRRKTLSGLFDNTDLSYYIYCLNNEYLTRKEKEEYKRFINNAKKECRTIEEWAKGVCNLEGFGEFLDVWGIFQTEWNEFIMNNNKFVEENKYDTDLYREDDYILCLGEQDLISCQFRPL